MIAAQQIRHPLEDLRPVANREALLGVQEAVRNVTMETSVRRYVAELAQATRLRKEVLLGASARAAIWLARAAQARAFVEGRRFVVPEDVKAVAHAVLDHRLLIEPRARLSGLTPGAVVSEAIEQTAVPLSPALAPPPGP